MNAKLSQRLKAKIEELAEQVYERSPLFTRTEKGLLTRQEFALYLYNLKHLLSEISGHIGCARARALELGQTQLAEQFLPHRLAEEIGHDQWAQHDIDGLSAGSPRQADGMALVPAIRELNAYIYRMTSIDPMYYLVYALLAEYFTVLVGPRWTASLERNCGIARANATVIVNHAELDKDHVSQELEILDAMPLAPERWTEESLTTMMQNVVSFYIEVARQVVGEERHERYSQKPSATVPALH